MFGFKFKKAKRRTVRRKKLGFAALEKRKAAQIEKGMTKAYAFFQRGIDLSAPKSKGFSLKSLATLKNVFPRKSGDHPKKRPIKYIHKTGDAGYQPNVMGKLVPKPFCRYQGIR